MYQYSELEEFVQALYRYGDLTRKQPSYRRMMEAFQVDIQFNAPVSCVDGDIILIERGAPGEEWEHVGHELGYFFRDQGASAALPPLYRHYVEHKAHQFRVSFLCTALSID